ncbi:MAG: thiamine pyrophosphate-binding protein [Burkholderiales bacterium]|nr:thiamine pyrophosphate-binding protein [Burkholderiales bacterium]
MGEGLQQRTGGQLLVDALCAHGADRAFCVPGESYLAVIDALYDVRERISLVVCRQEGGAAFMAEAYGKLTGRPGICMVTRGPGATNASIGVHTAYQDSTPMILFIGQIGSDVVEREAFQELDYRRMFAQMAKWVAQIDRADRVHEYVSHAFHVAMSGRPGPVVLALPEDMLVTQVATIAVRPYQRVKAHPGAQQLDEVADMLAGARRPLLLLGGGDWSERACDDIRSFAEAWRLPVACSFRRQDLLDNRHDQYVGEVGIATAADLKKRIAESDLVFAVGPRLGEMTTGGYTLFGIPQLRQRFIHVHPGADELGRVYQADLMINAGMGEFARAVRGLSPRGVPGWDEWTRSLRAEYLRTIEPVQVPGPVNMSEIIAWLNRRLPAGSIVANGAGNFSGWPQRFYQYTGFRTQLGPTNGAMGYGVPAAIAARMVHPDRIVVCFSGDGDFMMTGQELATAMQYQAPVVFVVVNNGMYGTIRMHQEREYPARVHGTALSNPDFVALARAYGAHGELVERTDQFAPAFERAVASGQPALLEVRLDPEVITTRTTLSAIRAAAQSKG